ncbi:GNAT family N-acetyltransferase [Flagellimonas allohymeniacidonis]|uniref:GNAT family N-acetyltransferase n=1 Tax=Flagellimonas allohymeniacidonis TaxID=2517819 RepID=A0A4Q8QGF4_9FLAO|nr:GNAT family N-acetyltransferase [Allomuricauda hymeniacidonis]TAI49561.1 GNAT family N-acetyltransferase [Allomuricauda hymeniacidonis]
MELELNTVQKPEVDELLVIFLQTGWAKNRNRLDIQRLIDQMEHFVTVRHGSQLVGFGRAISDGVYRALIEDIIVHEKFRGKGIGGKLVLALLAQIQSVEEIILHTETHLMEFYQDLGFRANDCLTMNIRNWAEQKT